MSTLRMSLYSSAAAFKRAERSMVNATGAPEGDWSRSDSHVMLEATGRAGSRPRDVYDWWLDEDNGAAAHNRVPYPDRFEKYVLDRTDLRRCERPSNDYMRKGSRATIYCTGVVPRGGTLMLAYFADAGELRRALGTAPGPGSCVPSGNEPGRRRYSLADRRRAPATASRTRHREASARTSSGPTAISGLFAVATIETRPSGGAVPVVGAHRPGAHRLSLDRQCTAVAAFEAPLSSKIQKS
jgi:hypothetical protein